MIDILCETNDYIVCVKQAGMLSELHETKRNMVTELIRQTGRDIRCVHRLDRDVAGVMVYACNPRAAAELSRQIASHGFEKVYFAIAHGKVDPPADKLTDLLFKDSRSGKVYVTDRVRKGVREASLTYRLLETRDAKSLLEVRLITGRSHQIRVQFASRQHPLVGDRRYGSPESCPIALFSREISFIDPGTQENVRFRAELPNGYPWNSFFASAHAPAAANETGST